jgi:hypothetical protein
MTQEDDPSKFRWPKNDDQLLRWSDDQSESVTFSECGRSRQTEIWDGYMYAGEALIDASNSKPYQRNSLIYPILFCYRHGLELALKWIITQYGGAAGVSAPRLDHDLWKLWESCKAVFEYSNTDVGEDIQAVEKIIKNFHDLDKSGESFRYSANRRGDLIPLPNGPKDLGNLRGVMKGVANFFDGWDAYLSELASYTDC